jgi:hypothetical protein
MEVFLGGALIVAWVIVLLWAMAKTAARALRGDQFNSGLAMGLIAGAAIAAGILLFIKNSLSSLDTIGAGFVLALIGSVTSIASVRSAK